MYTNGMFQAKFCVKTIVNNDTNDVFYFKKVFFFCKAKSLKKILDKLY